MNVCICDDEKIYCNYLYETLEVYFRNKKIEANVYVCNSIREFLKLEKTFDFIFMDIELADGNGMESIRHHEIYKQSCIFYISSHTEEAINGYKTNAFRFLTKPINLSDLLESLDTALTDYLAVKTLVIDTITANVVFKVFDIIYVEANDKVIGIRTIDNFYTTRETMGSILDKLDPNLFFSPHRSYIINFNHVKSFDKDFIVMINNEKVPISRLKRKEFLDKFYNHIRRKIHV